MIYKEACEVLDKACENWEAIYNDCKLEDALYEVTQRKSKESLQNLIESSFGKITNNVIEAEIVPAVASSAHTIMVYIHLDNRKAVTSTIYPWPMSSVIDVTEEQFISTLLQGIKSTLGKALIYESSVTPAEIVRISNCIRLIELDLRQGVFFPTIQKILNEREESNKRYTSIHHKYNNLTTGITQALAEASNAWYQEYTLIPGMKVVLENLRNGDISVKTIKSLSEKSAEPLLRFTDGTYTPVNSNRILKLSTWIVNNDQYKNIATTLKIPIAGVSF